MRQSQEVSRRDEGVVVLKVELATLQEKHRLLFEENEKLKQELSLSRSQNQSCLEEVQTLRISLEEARANGDRLHRESELVVENVNSWVQEQKHGNDRLAGKLREQSAQITALQGEKDRLSDTTSALQKENAALKSELEERRLEGERLKSLQSHSAQQQVLLHQLRNRLSDFENEQDADAANKAHTIDDLHERLKVNVDTIQQLNQQLSALNKDNLRQRHLLDRESAMRKSLQMQVEARDQTIQALKAQSDSKRFSDIPIRDTELISDNFHVNGDSYIDKGLSKPVQKDKIRSIMKKEIEKAGVNDPQVLDKSYWIQRVGEINDHTFKESIGHHCDNAQIFPSNYSKVANSGLAKSVISAINWTTQEHLHDTDGVIDRHHGNKGEKRTVPTLGLYHTAFMF
ncbi:predicted protein [Nematostella vectensis]|uniref:Uncharacterized protein n=1 Tax=Nematostella vectensis TaxID=45351 RepID=A7RHD3_NEMVE|nr:predicted protein [Nematostella vectensis]|eukprot:XP_001641273.1 predicted protein [Nematostella vectensis]